MDELNLTTLQWSELAISQGGKNTDLFRSRMNKKAAAMIDLYRNGDDIQIRWESKDLCFAKALFQSILRSKNKNISLKLLRSIVRDAESFQLVLKPMATQIAYVLKKQSQFQKIQHEMEIFSRLKRTHRYSRTVYLNFISDLVRKADSHEMIQEWLKAGTTDENNRFLYDTAIKIIKSAPAKESKKNTMLWIRRNLNLLVKLWESNFEKFKN